MTFKLFFPLLVLTGSIALAIYEYNHPPSGMSKFYHKGLDAYKEGDFKNAEYYFNMAVYEDSNDALSLFYRGISNLQQGKYEEAVSDCRKAIEMDKNLEKLYFDFKLEKYENHITEDVSSSVMDETEYTESSSTYNSLGLEEYNAGNYESAISYFESAIKVDEHYKYAYYNLGLCYYYLGNLDRAIEYYSSTLAIDPDYMNAYFERAYSKYEKGNYQGAINDYTSYIELDASEPSAYLNRGMAQNKLGNINQACADWEIAKSLDGDVSNLIEQYCN